MLPQAIRVCMAVLGLLGHGARGISTLLEPHSASVQLSQAPSRNLATLNRAEAEGVLSAKESIMPYGLQIVDTPGMLRAQETAGAHLCSAVRASEDRHACEVREHGRWSRLTTSGCFSFRMLLGSQRGSSLAACTDGVGQAHFGTTLSLCTLG